LLKWNVLVCEQEVLAMVKIMDDLGQRIVQAARLAVLLHTGAALGDDFGQRVRVGGAGPCFVTDDALPCAAGSRFPGPAPAEGAAA
jgi:hypothetical protein